MQVSVRFISVLAQEVGVKEMKADLSEDASLEDLLKYLVNRLGTTFQATVATPERVRDDVAITVDGFPVRNVDHRLKGGEVVFFSPIVVGG